MIKTTAAAAHPLLGLDVDFEGEAASVKAVFPAHGHLPERAMIELHNDPGRTLVVSTDRLKTVNKPQQ